MLGKIISTEGVVHVLEEDTEKEKKIKKILEKETQ
jgi:hypothetical protein